MIPMPLRQWLVALFLLGISSSFFSLSVSAEPSSAVMTPQATPSTPIAPQVSNTPSTAAPNPTLTPTSTPAPGVGSGIVTANPTMVIAGLLLVILMIVTVAWLLRRVGGVQMLGGQSMTVVSALSVGAREKVVLIDVEGEQILLGVAPGRVSHLKSFDEPVVEPKRSKSGDFSSTIRRLLVDSRGGKEVAEKGSNRS